MVAGGCSGNQSQPVGPIPPGQGVPIGTPIPGGTPEPTSLPTTGATATPNATSTPTASPAPTTSTSPTAAPSAAATNSSSRPAASGDSFAYVGSTTVAIVRPPITIAPPSPNPTDYETFTYGVTQAQNLTAGQTYNGVNNAYAFAIHESDALQGGLRTTTTASTEYYSYTPSGSTQLVRDLGGTMQTSGGDAIATTFGANNGLVDVLPEVAGPIPLPADATFSRSETDADSRTQKQTFDTNGTYTLTVMDVDGTTSTATTNADGSGTYSYSNGYATNLQFVVAAPATSGGTSAIALSITYPVGFNGNKSAVNEMRSVSTWYPQPLVLATKTLTDRGQTSVPPACGVPSALQRPSSNAVVSTATTVDPVFGELDTRTTTQYTEAGVGVVCVQSQDVLQQFYDFSGQEGQTISTSSAPLQTSTTTQSLGITSETVLGTTARYPTPIVAIAATRFSGALDRMSAQRHFTALRAIRARLARYKGVR